MRCCIPVTSERRVLCVFPAYSPSFGTFSHAYALMGRVRAFMPPQGLLVVAAWLPERWSIRFVDENMRRTEPSEFAWADVVFVSGMHIQADQIRDLQRRAKSAGALTVLGGPSVSAAPEGYPEFDYLHLGELGDATDRLVSLLDASIEPPDRQIRLTTGERLPLGDFPVPAYHLVPLDRYFLASVQFSSGCPYRCEFCDIPTLYGRQPRLKSPEQVMGELDVMRRGGAPSSIYFVDDNFIANRKATAELLPHLVRWQQRHGYPVQFACEATLNIAKQESLLELMRSAGFVTIFVGIETPEIEALKRIDKGHNVSLPMLEAVRKINSYGMEVVSGIILGLDTDTPETPDRLLEFVEHSRIPVLTINLLQALPRTPLWERLSREDRLVSASGREFERPVPAPLRGGRRFMEALRRRDLSATRAVRSVHPPGGCDLPQPARHTGVAQADAGQSAARLDHSRQSRRPGRGVLGISAGVLASGTALSRTRPNSERPQHRPGRTSSDPVLAGSGSRRAERLLLRAPGPHRRRFEAATALAGAIGADAIEVSPVDECECSCSTTVRQRFPRLAGTPIISSLPWRQLPQVLSSRPARNSVTAG